MAHELSSQDAVILGDNLILIRYTSGYHVVKLPKYILKELKNKRSHFTVSNKKKCRNACDNACIIILYSYTALSK